MENLGKTVWKIRKAKKIKQYELAAKIGVCKSYISQIESGSKIPSYQLIEKISEALEMPISLILILALDDKELPANLKSIKGQVQSLKNNVSKLIFI